MTPVYLTFPDAATAEAVLADYPGLQIANPAPMPVCRLTGAGVRAGGSARKLPKPSDEVASELNGALTKTAALPSPGWCGRLIESLD